jgi:hypothetical protein
LIKHLEVIFANGLYEEYAVGEGEEDVLEITEKPDTFVIHLEPGGFMATNKRHVASWGLQYVIN